MKCLCRQYLASKFVGGELRSTIRRVLNVLNPLDGSVPHRCAAPSVVPFALQQSALNFTGVSRRDDFRHHTADPPDGSLCLRLGTRRRTCVFATGGGVLPCGPGGHSSGLKGDAAQITSSSRRPAPPDAKVPGGPRGPARDRGSPSRAADGLPLCIDHR